MHAITRRHVPAYIASLGLIGSGGLLDARAAEVTPREPLAARRARVPMGSGRLRLQLDGVAFDVFTYKPAGPLQGVLLVFHGTDRNADDYRRRAAPLADRYGLLVAAPLFDERRFDTTEYHRANLLPGLPPRRWNTRFAPLLLRAMREREGPHLPGYLFGFSAGGQYVARVAAVERLENVARIVSGGASTYVLPRLGAHPGGEAAPYGLGGLYPDDVGPAQLQAYLQAPYGIVCGELDDDPDAANLTSTAGAERQGRTRLERARFTYNDGLRVAREHGLPLAWGLHVVPGVGHSSSAVLRSVELQRALRLGPAVQL